MPVHRIRPRHRARVTSSADFIVDAAAPGAAAQLVADAYRVSLAKDSPVITLPNGESALLEPHEIEFADIAFVAINDAGEESEPIALPHSGLH